MVPIPSCKSTCQENPPPHQKKKLTNDKTDSQIVEILIEKNKVSGNLAFHRGMVSTRDLYNI